MRDETIVRKFWDRNEDAVTEAKKHYDAYCLYIAENILFNKQDAEECFNDALLAAWNSIPPQRPENLKTYLGKLTREIAIDRWRKNKAQKRAAAEPILSFDELEDMLGAGSVEEAVEDKELARHISAFLRTLRKTERNVFVRRYWFCDPIEKIGERYGFSKGKVAMMLKRTRDRLAEYLKKEGLRE